MIGQDRGSFKKTFVESEMAFRTHNLKGLKPLDIPCVPSCSVIPTQRFAVLPARQAWSKKNLEGISELIYVTIY